MRRPLEPAETLTRVSRQAFWPLAWKNLKHYHHRETHFQVNYTI